MKTKEITPKKELAAGLLFATAAVPITVMKKSGLAILSDFTEMELLELCGIVIFFYSLGASVGWTITVLLRRIPVITHMNERVYELIGISAGPIALLLAGLTSDDFRIWAFIVGLGFGIAAQAASKPLAQARVKTRQIRKLARRDMR